MSQFIEESQELEEDSQDILEKIAFEKFEVKEVVKKPMIKAKKQEAKLVKKPMIKKRKLEKDPELYISPEEEFEDLSETEMMEFEEHLKAGRASTQ
jgi:hypothetical protein